MAQRTRSDELDVNVLRAATNQRADLVVGVLDPGEVLVADPAVCLFERTKPPGTAAVEAFLYASDRRLLVRAVEAETAATWAYRDVISHAIDRCAYRPFFRLFPLSTRLRTRRRYFATLTFVIDGGESFAAHGSRPYLEAIEAVLDGDPDRWT